MEASMPAATSAPDAVRFRHEAFFYGDQATFLAGVLPFVRAALEVHEPVMVVLRSEKLAAVRAALGSESRDVTMADMAVLGANPALIIPAWRRFLNEHAASGRAVHGIGEPIWAGRSPAELAESQLHEALLNRAFADDSNFTLLCPYDTAALGPAVLDAAVHSHPFLSGGRTAPSCEQHALAAPADFLALALPEPVAPVEQRRFGSTDLATVRRLAQEMAVRAGLADRSTEVGLAVHEVAANSARHGGGHGSLRTWLDGTELVFEISDAGHLDDPLVGRIEPRPDAVTGRGLWLVNHLCDLVQLRNTPDGVIVRLHFRGTAP